MGNLMLKLKPSSFTDLVASVALFRPGPAVNIDSYIKRKHHEEKITYQDPSLEKILSNTYGIFIYQEQIIQLASIYANYTLGEADILRRAVSKKKKEVLEKERVSFVEASMNKGYSQDVANNIYDYL